MSNPELQQQSFQERLARINQRQSGTEYVPGIDPEADLLEQPKASQKPAPSAVPPLRENLKYPLSFVRAFAVGAIAIFAIRVARFHMFSDTLSEDGLETAFFIDLVLAVMIGFILRTALSLQSKELQTAQTVGVVLMLTGMHNLYHWTPAPMGVLTSAEYVQDMQEWSVPNSFYWRGNYFQVGGDDKKPSKPKVSRGGFG